ncbi:MAG: hypothetical protein A2X05_18280 [Bacteroidetes bacterium GWE2_41_25]|nr:MAG: hypothetical protein A2X03_16735 [Bacteroidetes bacterium GWA2_40_15]OFY01425.1 MAG: hypothetical protein A2X06_09520 [Bacteroidetes bacterium GWC2_40_22]OFY02149.1 MAG: hypothetical protein A2X05_18280 [Bacteroidetes bacterium GWE2_41_25]HAM09716.1 hypothetical protein [Bacteroidales bacterium]HBH82692.1 hypothetical protein [Bacteroidales bacterium]
MRRFLLTVSIITIACLIITSCQSANTFDQLRVPEGDPNIILSYHFYEPFFLTHYRAGWTNLKDFEGKVNYPGQIVLDGKLPEHKKIYNRDMISIFEEHNVAYANWNYKSTAFGIVDDINVPQPKTDILLGKK